MKGGAEKEREGSPGDCWVMEAREQGFHFEKVGGVSCLDWKTEKGDICFELKRNGSVVKNPPADAGDTQDVGSIPGSGRSPGEGNDNPLQYSCLGNSMDRGAWRATVHGVIKSWTRLSEQIHTLLNDMSG